MAYTITPDMAPFVNVAAVEALHARARYMGANSIDGTDLITVEVGGQDEDVILTHDSALYLYRQLGMLLDPNFDLDS